jgi:hypothetical protein
LPITLALAEIMPTPRKMKKFAALLQCKKTLLNRINAVFLCVLLVSAAIMKSETTEYFGLAFAVSFYVVFAILAMTFTRWTFYLQRKGSGVLNGVFWFFHPLDMYYVGESHRLIQWFHTVFLTIFLMAILSMPFVGVIVWFHSQ